MGPARRARPVRSALILDGGRRYAARVDDAVARRIVAGDAAPARGSAARIVLVAVATVMWTGVVVAVVAGVLLIGQHTSFWAVNAGIGLLLLVILLRPRVGRAPRQASTVSRTAAPLLWQLVDRIATHIGAAPPDRIVLDLDYHAVLTRVGPRGRIVLRLGARLWVSAEPDQRVAMLAHELAYLVGRDPARMRIVRPVLETFDRLASLAGPHSSLPGVWRANVSRINIVGLLVAVVRLLVGRVFAVLHLALRAVALSDHLRAEYGADALAAEVSGTSATLGLFDRVRLSGEIQNFLYYAAADRRPEQWGAGVYALVAMRTRPRMSSDTSGFTLWDTLPSAARRSEVLTGLPWHEPSLTQDAEDAAALDRELTSWCDALREELLGAREFVGR